MDHLSYWLTSDELVSLADTEKLARILVRWVTQDPYAAIWPTAAGDAPHDEQALMATARDRGFQSAAGAVEAARSFILSAVSGSR
jgi:hypothetical protein